MNPGPDGEGKTCAYSQRLLIGYFYANSLLWSSADCDRHGGRIKKGKGQLMRSYFGSVGRDSNANTVEVVTSMDGFCDIDD